jgi:long-chain acyl-CoA synthetase
MNYTSGTTGPAERVSAVRLLGISPEEAALGLGGVLFLSASSPTDDNVHIIGSPLYHTAVMRFGGASMHLGHTVVLMDKWDPEGMLKLIERYKVTTSHMVPTQFHRLLALPEERSRALRPVLAPPHDPRRCAVSDRHQARHDRMVGTGHRRVLRRERGRWHARHAPKSG